MFLGNFMGNIACRERYRELAADYAQKLNVRKELNAMDPSDYFCCDAFADVDALLIASMAKSLADEDMRLRIGGKKIDEICALRTEVSMYFHERYEDRYGLLEHAYRLLESLGRAGDIRHDDAPLAQYLQDWYRVDTHYRDFYLYYNRIDEKTDFEGLRARVENAYRNCFLEPLALNWSEHLARGKEGVRECQDAFFARHVSHYRGVKDSVVVIVSDALRYECAAELKESLLADERCESAELGSMLAMLPSITSMGMAALLPHKRMEVAASGAVLCDGQPCADLPQREKLLQAYCSSGACIRLDEVLSLRQEELRALLNGKDIVYVYHNQIDARGDKPASEHEVFAACEEALDEIRLAIRRLTTMKSYQNYIVTADHGFLYTRDSLEAYSKISVKDAVRDAALAGKRYILGGDPLPEEVLTLQSPALEGFGVTLPRGIGVFNMPGSGLNYVHGGASLQEMLVPVLKVRTRRGAQAVHSARLMLLSGRNRLTSLTAHLDFMQTEPVGDIVKPAVYSLWFEDEGGEKLSTPACVEAANKDEDAKNRMFRVRFTLKNRRYPRDKKYFLMIQEEGDSSRLEPYQERTEFMVDVALADDFTF